MNNDDNSRGKSDDGGPNFAVVPPNGGWGWIVVICAFYCNVIVDGIQLTFGIFLKEISQSFDTEYSKVALAGSLMFGSHLLMGPFCSGFSSVFGLRPITMVGALICSVGVGLSFFATECWYLYLTYGIIGGVGLGLIYMNTLVITGLYFTTLMPIAMGIVVCGTGVGTMIFAALGYYLLKVTTWQFSFLIQSGLAFSTGIAAIAFKPLKPIRVKLSTSQEASTSFDSNDENRERASIFLKRDTQTLDSSDSLKPFHSLMWESYLDQHVVQSIKRKKLCECECTNKRRKRKQSVLILSELKSTRNERKKSYVGKLSFDYEGSAISRISSIRNDSLVKQDKIALYERIDVEKKDKTPLCDPLRRTMIASFDCRLLRSCAFFMFTLSGAFQMASLLIVFTYEEERCRQLGFTEEMSINFIITLGGANTFWRLFLGGIATIKRLNHAVLAVSGICVGGVATMLSGLFDNIYYHFGFCFLFGLGMASFAVFRILILLDLIEISQMENATGINLLFMGIIAIIFPPLFGKIMELTHSYNVIFISTGLIMITSGAMLLFLKKLRKRELLKLNRTAAPLPLVD